ncbi:MAG: hypothetical protein JXB26_05980 [Candidatus Aminicenantes bacterium]|nr:hypothetical protein [Candidatus Aminicenantes bacterium]
MKKKKFIIKAAILCTVSFMLISCNPLENDSLSNSILILKNLLGTDLEGNSSNYLQSDVLKVDEQTGASYVIADSATASFEVQLLNPDTATTEPSQYNSITLTHYIVSYSRTDGKNEPGKDVPYGFEGYMSTLIEVGTVSTIAFIVVREVAKLEQPLVDLSEGRAEGVLQVIATIDFYGKDMLGNTVKASGQLTIYFANYNDS